MEPFVTVLLIAAVLPYACGTSYLLYMIISGESYDPTRGLYVQIPNHELKIPLVGRML